MVITRLVNSKLQQYARSFGCESNIQKSILRVLFFNFHVGFFDKVRYNY